MLRRAERGRHRGRVDVEPQLVLLVFEKRLGVVELAAYGHVTLAQLLRRRRS